MINFKKQFRLLFLLFFGTSIVLALAACGPTVNPEKDKSTGKLASNTVASPTKTSVGTSSMSGMNMGSSTSNAVGGSATGSASASKNASAMTPTVSFTLKTNIADGRLGFVGVGGDIEGKTNPTLKVKPGDVVQITLINGDGAEHDLAVPDFNVQSNKVLGKGASSVVVLQANKAGEFSYFCTVPGHRAAGMEGKIVVGEGAPQVVATGASVGRDPGDMPPAIGKRGPENVRIDLETVEVEGQLADGVTYTYWTFNGKVPGPFIRVREGDTVELHLKNSIKSVMTHSIDLHAVTGPGGGATVMQVPPGEEKSFTFKALNPGLYVYHCATAMVAHHIASGMYGMILVEPEGGLPPVDHEYYVMQGEIYTSQPVNQKGRQEFSVDKLLNERPEYVVFNGAVGSLTKDHPLTAKVGETVRIYFGVGGPNLTSSFHVIGEIFDRIYSMASLTAPPLTDVQTTTVAPGGATVVEFKVQVPGRYILVDHALSRLERGAAGYLVVDGPENHEIYTGVMSGDTGGH